ncbi:hypothetical protein [Actinoplanes awajinensis]|uniref:Uncharacterized protein n=1 Tax=Actinoplanes awajinensis subsp. mycoplanecinus TaxID=135947 RepID=A0A0X3UV05_9ACTN|nr:hypothetical protein [Actinoplanes awajinensis]KUL34696.1 hypothetical protein ADL15_15120 [Actinoplanes awajinensis subsp. mycoplanecinus]
MTHNQHHRRNINRRYGSGATPVGDAQHPYVYFIAFHAMRDGGAFFGNGEFGLTCELTSMDQVLEVEESLRAQGYTHAKILGFSLLRTVTVPRSREQR